MMIVMIMVMMGNGSDYYDDYMNGSDYYDDYDGDVKRYRLLR